MLGLLCAAMTLLYRLAAVLAIAAGTKVVSQVVTTFSLA